MQQLAALGIDLTSLVIYTVNFGIIYIVVSRLIAKPILEILENRKIEIETNLNEANKIREEMLTEKKKFEAEKEKIRNEFDQELLKFEESLKERSKYLELQNQRAREEIIQKALAEQKQIKENIFKIIQQDLINSYSVIISKILKEDTTSENIKSSIESSWESFKSKKL